MGRRFSPFFSIFRALLTLLLLHPLREISAADSMLTSKQMSRMFEKMKKDAQKIIEGQERLAKDGWVIKSCNRTTDSSIMRMKHMDPIYHEWEKVQMPYELASDYLSTKYNKTFDDAEFQSMTLSGKYSQKHQETCLKTKQPAQCDKYARYRTADGQCNNVQYPTYGSTSCCQDRLLPPHYVGSSGFRESVKGGPLPEPRDLSLYLHYHLNRPTYKWTHMFVFYGQFLDHDITLTPQSTTGDNEAIQCCPPKENTHSQCKPIRIRNDDPFYAQYNITCLNFVRSAVCRTCTFGHRQQPEQVTSFIDGSVIYGNSDNETHSLRKNDGTGQMRVQKNKYGDLMPRSSDPKGDQCSFPEKKQYCFQGGDPRTNQHMALTSLQTMQFRNHNRLARRLRVLNPHWDDERLFQEARRINGAQMQVIAYKEYITIALGKDAVDHYKLNIGTKTKYNPYKKPCMLVEFTTACFRFGHTLINSAFADSLFNATGQQPQLRDYFFKPFPLYKGIAGPLLSCVSYSRPQEFDQHMVPDVTNYLYRVPGDKSGMDLASFNIQRGRDHGLPPYVVLVYYCSKGKIDVRSFDDLVTYNLMKPEQAEDLKRCYKDVRDVDLFPGVVMEIPNPKAAVGPTAACVVAKQFYKLKYGDRFYFEHSNVPQRFSDKQMEELRKVTLSKLICLNMKVKSLPMNAMLFPSYENPVIYCKDVKGMDLSYWKEDTYGTDSSR